jgi:hypothetical protein
MDHVRVLTIVTALMCIPPPPASYFLFRVVHTCDGCNGGILQGGYLIGCFLYPLTPQLRGVLDSIPRFYCCTYMTISRHCFSNLIRMGRDLIRALASTRIS